MVLPHRFVFWTRHNILTRYFRPHPGGRSNYWKCNFPFDSYKTRTPWIKCVMSCSAFPLLILPPTPFRPLAGGRHLHSSLGQTTSGHKVPLLIEVWNTCTTCILSRFLDLNLNICTFFLSLFLALLSLSLYLSIYLSFSFSLSLSLFLLIAFLIFSSLFPFFQRAFIWGRPRRDPAEDGCRQHCLQGEHCRQSWQVCCSVIWQD